MVKTKYPCTQKDLYPASRLGVKKLITIAEPLTKLKSKYSGTFFSDFMSEIDDSESLPDHSARIARVKNLSVDIVEKRATALNHNVKLPTTPSRSRT